MLLIATILVMPIITAEKTNASAKTVETNEISDDISTQNTPHYYKQNMVELFSSIKADNSEYFEDHLLALYEEEGVRADFSELYGSKFVEYVDNLFSGHSYNPNFVGYIDLVRTSKKNQLTSFKYLLEEAIVKDISYADFDDGLHKIDSTQAENIYNDVKTEIDNIPNFGGVMDKLRHYDDEEGNELDPLKVVLWVLWIAAWTGSSMLPVFNKIVPFVVSIVVGVVIGAVVALALDEIGVIDGIADKLRDIMGSVSPGLSELDYEGALSFIIGGIAFSAYFLAYQTTRVTKFFSAAGVALAGLVIVDLVVDELRKQGSKSKSMDRLLPFKMPLLNALLSNLLRKLTTLKVKFFFY